MRMRRTFNDLAPWDKELGQGADALGRAPRRELR